MKVERDKVIIVATVGTFVYLLPPVTYFAAAIFTLFLLPFTQLVCINWQGEEA